MRTTHQLMVSHTSASVFIWNAANNCYKHRPF